MLLDLFLIVIGIAILVKGSDLLVDSASRIAVKAGVPAIVIGLSLVAVGTSLPELVVGVDASLGGAGDIVIGNVIGSNIVNICIVIGIGALIKNIKAGPDTVRVEVPMTIAATVLLMLLSLDGALGPADGAVLLAAALLFFSYVFWRAKKEGVDRIDENIHAGIIKESIMTILGIVMAYAGGVLTVDSTISIASALGISPYLIAVTLIAFGTNLPEITTSIIASLKDKGDLILGNGLGSINVNILLIVGICAIINPIRVTDQSDIIISIFFCLLLMLLLFRGRTLTKKEGTLLVLFYAGYILYKVAMQVT